MKVQLLPSTFSESGGASSKQHLSCFVIDDCIAIDAGSLAMATSLLQKERIRDVVLTHAHIDHIAGLPLFVDDLFATLSEPIRVHASREVIDVLERDIFNWSVYPRFSELSNENGKVLEYVPFVAGKCVQIKHISIMPKAVNHQVPSYGFIISDDSGSIAFTGDTSEMDDFWTAVNSDPKLKAVLIECAFPDELGDLARVAHHLTPSTLESELRKFTAAECPIFAINLKPMYREQIVGQLEDLGIGNLGVLEVGRVYDW